jgi:predicted nucleic acid-binding protein
MDRLVFVDTSAWVGYFAARDQHHSDAVAAFNRMGEEGREFVTTDYVLAETVTRIRRQGSPEAAETVWRVLEEERTARLLEVDVALRSRARRLLLKYRQLPLSLVDCVSFAVMRELGIREALTFDGDFAKAGFVMIPGRL